MLHESAISPELLNLLRRFQPRIGEQGFALAGGTSLALRFGHRISTDLDWFTDQAFDPPALVEHLEVGPESIIGMADGTLRLNLQDTKLEFLRHAYPRLADHEQIQDLVPWSVDDVTAMKLNAIANRGSKKVFFDLAALLGARTLPEILETYRSKSRPASMLMIVRSLVWFDDAEVEPDPISLTAATWESVKDRIRRAVRELD